MAASFTTGCKSKQPPVVEGHAPKSQASSAASSAQPRSAPTVRESDAQAVLDKWLKAQNAGDFAGYSALYAERFQGIKRVGARTHRFDRKGWLKDRGAMFEKPMKVEISDVAIKTTCCMAAVRFVQKWSSATFQDQGTKELLMVPSAAGLQISGEEMLLSNVARAGKAADLDAKDIRLVVHAKHSYVMLATAAPEIEGYGQIALDSEFKQGVVTTRRLINTEGLAPDVKNAKGMAVRLFGRAGFVCAAKLGETFLLRRVTPHFGTVGAWTGTGDSEGQPPMLLADITKSAWEEAAEGGMYAAEILPTDGDCSAAIWARERGRSEPDLFRSEPAGPQLEARLEAAMRALPAYARVATGYSQEKPKNEEPWEYYDGAKPEYLVWRSADRTLGSVVARAGNGCGDFAGYLWALFEVRGDEMRLLNDPGSDNEPGALKFEGIVDTNQDGSVEILAGDSDYPTKREANALLRAAAKGYEVVRSNYPPFHDCGC